MFLFFIVNMLVSLFVFLIVVGVFDGLDGFMGYVGW